MRAQPPVHAAARLPRGRAFHGLALGDGAERGGPEPGGTVQVMAADHHDKVAARVWMLCPRHIELSHVVVRLPCGRAYLPGRAVTGW